MFLLFISTKSQFHSLIFPLKLNLHHPPPATVRQQQNNITLHSHQYNLTDHTRLSFEDRTKHLNNFNSRASQRLFFFFFGRHFCTLALTFPTCYNLLSSWIEGPIILIIVCHIVCHRYICVLPPCESTLRTGEERKSVYKFKLKWRKKCEI